MRTINSERQEKRKYDDVIRDGCLYTEQFCQVSMLVL